MSYLAVDQLSNDTAFAGRNRACCMEQAETFKDDTRADIVAVADAILRDEGGLYLTFTRMAAAGPGSATRPTTATAPSTSRKSATTTSCPSPRPTGR